MLSFGQCFSQKLPIQSHYQRRTFSFWLTPTQVAAGILLCMSLLGKAIYNPCKHFDYISQERCLLSVTLWSEPIAHS